MAARKKKEAEAKKKKAAPVGKSTIVFDVKPACLDGDDDDSDGDDEVTRNNTGRSMRGTGLGAQLVARQRERHVRPRMRSMEVA